VSKFGDLEAKKPQVEPNVLSLLPLHWQVPGECWNECLKVWLWPEHGSGRC